MASFHVSARLMAGQCTLHRGHAQAAQGQQVIYAPLSLQVHAQCSNPHKKPTLVHTMGGSLTRAGRAVVTLTLADDAVTKDWAPSFGGALDLG